MNPDTPAGHLPSLARRHGLAAWGLALLSSALLLACGGGKSDASGRSAPSFRIAGTFTGLAQGSVTVSVGLDQKVIATQGDGVIRDIPFEMPSTLPSGVPYELKVLSSDPNVSCEVRDGSGVVQSADVSNILVQCFSVPSLRLLAGRLPKPDVDGLATQIAFVAESLAVASDGSIYLGADSGRGASFPLIRRITPTGFLTTLAGGSVGPAADGQGSAARLSRPRGLVFEPNGNLLFGDGTALRRLDREGRVTTVAGSLASAGTTDTDPGALTPDPLAARFTQLEGLARAGDGTVYLSDRRASGSAIRKLAPDGRVTTVVTSADHLHGLTLALDGQLYVGRGVFMDGGVARVNMSASPATLQNLNDPQKPPSPVGNLSTVVALVPETATSLIALGQRFGQLARFFTDGRPAEFLTGSDGGFTLTKCLDGKLAGAQFNLPRTMISLGPGKLLIADSLCQSLRVVDLGAGQVSTLYGSLGFGTADGIGEAAAFHGVSGLAVDAVNQRLMTTEALGLLVRSVGIDGTVRTLVGEPTNTHPGDFPAGSTFVDGPAATATFANPSALVADPAGGYFLLDKEQLSLECALRRVEPDGSVATWRRDVPCRRGIVQQYMVRDSTGRFVVSGSHVISRFGRTGAIESWAGNGTAGYANSPATPQLDTPGGLAIARDGSVYVADIGNRAIRRIASDGTVSMVAGRFTGGGGGPNGRFTSPVAITLTESGEFLLVLDNQQFVIMAVDLRAGSTSAVPAIRTVVGRVGADALALGPLPGALAPPYRSEGLFGFTRSTEWDSHAMLVKGGKLYIALGDAILEADLALR